MMGLSLFMLEAKYVEKHGVLNDFRNLAQKEEAQIGFMLGCKLAYFEA